MRAYRATVALMAVTVWVLSAPLAMASNNCMAMGAMCEGPCGASSCVTGVGGPAESGLPFFGTVLVRDPHEPPTATPALVELPPRSSFLFS